jgi:hypothetical protein
MRKPNEFGFLPPAVEFIFRHFGKIALAFIAAGFGLTCAVIAFLVALSTYLVSQ